MPPKRTEPYNTERLAQLSQYGYILLGDLPDANIRWPALKMKKLMGQFVFVRKKILFQNRDGSLQETPPVDVDEGIFLRKNFFFHCQDSFLRETTPLEFDTNGNMIETTTFSPINTENFIYTIINTLPSAESPKEKFIFLIRETLESGHSFLAGPYYESSLARLVVGGNLWWEDGQLIYGNGKSGGLKNVEFEVRFMLNKIFTAQLFGEMFLKKIFKFDITEAEERNSYDELSPRAARRKLRELKKEILPSPLPASRSLSSFNFMSPEMSSRTLSGAGMPSPKHSLRGIASRPSLRSPSLSQRTLSETSLSRSPSLSQRTLSETSLLRSPALSQSSLSETPFLSPLTHQRTLSEASLLSLSIHERTLPENFLLNPNISTRALAGHAFSENLSLRTPQTSKRSLDVFIPEEEKIIPRILIQNGNLAFRFFKSNPLVEFILIPSQGCEGRVLAHGIQLLSAALLKHPNSILNIIISSTIRPSYLLWDLNEKIQKQNKVPKASCVEDLENLYQPCLARLVKVCIYNTDDLDRCIAVMPSYEKHILGMVLSNKPLKRHIFSSSLTQTPSETRDALTQKYPKHMDKILRAYDELFPCEDTFEKIGTFGC